MSDVAFRAAVARVGALLGWASIVVVLLGLAFDASVGHRPVLVAVTLAAAGGNAVATVAPWHEWLRARRGRLLVDLWCGGVIALIALLVLEAGSSFSLLLFLGAPFVAVVQHGARRTAWLAGGAATCVAVAYFAPLPAGATAIRLALVSATVAVALLLTRAIRREIAAREDASARAELERALAREASHRVKNDLQTAADLLLLARPESEQSNVFDETAARLRSIATVHRLLMDGGPIDGGVLLRRIVQNAPVPVDVEAEPGSFDAETAKKLGIVANELVMNASRHGALPIVVRLHAGELTRLAVDDGGGEVERPPGFGLDLVGLMVERGLGGRFELRRRSGGGTRAEVVFPVAQA